MEALASEFEAPRAQRRAARAEAGVRLEPEYGIQQNRNEQLRDFYTSESHVEHHAMMSAPRITARSLIPDRKKLTVANVGFTLVWGTMCTAMLVLSAAFVANSLFITGYATSIFAWGVGEWGTEVFSMLRSDIQTAIPGGIVTGILAGWGLKRSLSYLSQLFHSQYD